MDNRYILRGMWLVQGHITGEEEEQGLNAAVSSELGPWLHSGLPRAVGWVVLVSLCLDLAWGWGLELEQSRGTLGEHCGRRKPGEADPRK